MEKNQMNPIERITWESCQRRFWLQWVFFEQMVRWTGSLNLSRWRKQISWHEAKSITPLGHLLYDNNISSASVRPIRPGLLCFTLKHCSLKSLKSEALELKTVDHQVLRRMVWRKWAYRYITVFKRINFSTEQYKPTNWFRFTFCGGVEGGGLQFSFSHLVTWEACCASRCLWFTWTQ